MVMGLIIGRRSWRQLSSESSSRMSADDRTEQVQLQNLGYQFIICERYFLLILSPYSQMHLTHISTHTYEALSKAQPS